MPRRSEDSSARHRLRIFRLPACLASFALACVLNRAVLAAASPRNDEPAAVGREGEAVGTVGGGEEDVWAAPDGKSWMRLDAAEESGHPNVSASRGPGRGGVCGGKCGLEAQRWRAASVAWARGGECGLGARRSWGQLYSSTDLVRVL